MPIASIDPLTPPSPQLLNITTQPLSLVSLSLSLYLSLSSPCIVLPSACARGIGDRSLVFRVDVAAGATVTSLIDQ